MIQLLTWIFNLNIFYASWEKHIAQYSFINMSKNTFVPVNTVARDFLHSKPSVLICFKPTLGKLITNDFTLTTSHFLILDINIRGQLVVPTVVLSQLSLDVDKPTRSSDYWLTRFWKLRAKRRLFLFTYRDVIYTPIALLKVMRKLL